MLTQEEQWLLSLPDVKWLGYFYRDFVETKVYEERSRKLFTSEDKLKKKVESVWNIWGIIWHW